MSRYNIPYQYKKEIFQYYPKYNNVCNYRIFFFFLVGTQERVRNSSGKQAISVQATENLLMVLCEAKYLF